MKKLLIMVQACNNATYVPLMRSQQQTWDSIEVEGVKTMYYYGGKYEYCEPVSKEVNSWEYCSGTSDEYEMMHWKFKKAMDHVWPWDWDFVLRTNASTYINKQKVLDFIQDKPTEKYYSGVNGGNFVSGTNALISRDCIDMARKQFSISPNASEDSYLGSVLLSNGIEIKDGIDRPHFNYDEPHKIIDAHCYRCKSPDADRSKDIFAFETLFKHYHNNKSNGTLI